MRWLRYYPLRAFGENRVAASIDTPLHAFIPLRPRGPSASRLGDRAGCQRQWKAQAGGVQPAIRPQDRLAARGSVPDLNSRCMLRKGRQRKSRMRRRRAREPRPVHLGQYAAGMLLEQRQHHRSDGRVHPRTPSEERGSIRRPANTRRGLRIARKSQCRFFPLLRGVMSSNRRVIAHYG